MSKGDEEHAWSGKMILEGSDQVKVSWNVTETVTMKVVGSDFPSHQITMKSLKWSFIQTLQSNLIFQFQ
ncbi:MAG: hypothetical protein ABWY16_11100 [Pedobacter sp.]|uniref:hypothetical protein n=1 Tax=Pedobacter sp. TaxID=1411316 RepID=UPI0033941F43